MADKYLKDFDAESPNLTDYIIMTGGTGNDSDYKTLSSAMAQLLIETYAGSTLGGSARSVQSAIAYVVDELSQRLALTTGDRTSIPTGSDLDTYTAIGNYKVTTATIASNIDNMPVALAGMLWVMTSSDSAKWYQIYFANKAGLQIFARTKLSSSGAWSAWNEITYRYTFDSAPTDGSTNPVTSGGVHTAIASVETEVAKKADAEGESPDLVAGSANAILSDSYTEDSVPYKYRRTPYKSKRLSDEIVGGSVVWNQLLDVTTKATTTSQGVTYTNNGNGSFTLTGTPTAINTFENIDWVPNVNPYKLGHIYLLFSGYAGELPIGVRIYGIGQTGYDTYSKGYSLKRATELGANGYVRFQITNIKGTDIGTVKLTPQLFDLTAMFGTAIADYIYGLETATAGAGVAFFRSLFGASYYPYNAGELVSISGLSAHKTVGKNLLDFESRLKAWNSTYAKVGDNSFSVSTTGTGYREPYQFSDKDIDVTISGVVTDNSGAAGWRIELLNSDGTLVGGIRQGTTSASGKASKVRLNYNTGGNGAVYSNMQIEYGLTATAYEPYEEHVYPLDDSLTLRGVPKLVDNKIKFDGDIYASDGTVTRRYGVVDLGTLSWSYLTNYNEPFFRSALSDKMYNNNTFVLCEKYPFYGNTSLAIIGTGAVSDKMIATHGSNNGVCIKDSTYDTAASFAASLSGVYLVYELATPTTETAEPYQTIQACDPDGTEEYVTTGIVPVGHNTRYYRDIDAVIPAPPAADGTYVLKCTVSGGVATYSWATQ